MKIFSLFALLCAGLVPAQGPLPWGGQAVSIPMLATQSGVALFYVASYTGVGSHTDYDMARQAADAYLKVNPQTPTFVVLGPAQIQTCDDVPLPTASLGLGTSSTVSIIGYGSNVSMLVKKPGCITKGATLNVSASSAAGPIVNALYQGFTVSANHVDASACGFYGISNSVFFDVACGNALPGSDHEVEFGSASADASGQVNNVTIRNLKAFDNVGVGNGAVLLPEWSSGHLAGATVTNGGSSMYTRQFTRVQVVGPDSASCAVTPLVKAEVSNLSSVAFAPLPATEYGYLTGVTVMNAGNCLKTSRLYLLIQDGVPTTYGIKFTKLVGSHIWNVESTASSYYGEGWLRQSNSNWIAGEHIYTNQTIQVLEYGTSNKHYNAFFDGPAEYGAAIFGRSGSFINSIFSWNSSSYLASSGYYFGSPAQSFERWVISNSQCTNSTENFASVSTQQGLLLPEEPVPAGIVLEDIEDCNGSHSVEWTTQVKQPSLSVKR